MGRVFTIPRRQREPYLFLLTLFFTASLPAQELDVQTGIASYYAEEFHGRRTSNGELFDMNSLTAAHQSLPYNTRVRVTNLSNGKSVVVRINDAGPFKDNRIIDLSHAAASRIGMVKQGTVRVRLEILETDPTVREFYRSDMHPVLLDGFMIQLNSFSSMSNARAYLERTGRKLDLDLYIQRKKVKGREVYRVVTGPFTTRGSAESELRILRKRGMRGFVYRIR